MTYKLFIGDERYPVTDDWVIVRTSFGAFETVSKFGMPKEISFDHDLGGDDTSMIFLRELGLYIMDTGNKFPKDFKYSIHSQNPVGAKNIKVVMDGLIRMFKD